MNSDEQYIHPTTRAADLLEQIAKVDTMIELHADNPFMRDQYRHRKQQWVNELSAILHELGLLEGQLRAA